MLGVGVLSEFDLLVDLKKGKFIDKVTGLSSFRLYCNCPPECVNVTTAAYDLCGDILREFPTLTSSLQDNEPVLHNDKHHVKPKSPLTFSKLQRLDPPPKENNGERLLTAH